MISLCTPCKYFRGYGKFSGAVICRHPEIKCAVLPIPCQCDYYDEFHFIHKDQTTLGGFTNED